MARPQQNEEIRRFLLERAEVEGTALIPAAMAKFGISRPTVSRYLRRLGDADLLSAEGPPRRRRYSLIVRLMAKAELPLVDVNDENELWRQLVAPQVGDLPRNIVDILQHGATEMINNAIDHSEAKTLKIEYGRTALTSVLTIQDDGVGVFEKIRRDCKYDDARHALLELSKGKLTTAPDKHTGEGLFFTSRMFNQFILDSRGLAFIRSLDEDGASWLLEVDHLASPIAGTRVVMEIRHDAKQMIAAIFRQFEDADDPHDFVKTHVPVRLARYGDEQLVSRSQAKRVLARFERFTEVMLDFEDVPRIGQAFADEIFRVFANAHPGVTIVPINMTPDVERMYRRALAHEPHG